MVPEAEVGTLNWSCGTERASGTSPADEITVYQKVDGRLSYALPGAIESRRTDISPEVVTTCATNCPTKPMFAPVAGRAGPEKTPVVALIAGAFGIAAVMLTPRPNIPMSSAPALS